MQPDRIREMEADLLRVAGVETARIRTESGEITEVHVVSDPGRRPKWIVRDVITTLFARHGIRVPHQRVSVAGSAPSCEIGTPVAGPQPTRLTIASVQLSCEGDRLAATVELKDGGRMIRATSEAWATRANHLRAVAAATLEAVRKTTGGIESLHLEEVRRVEMGEISVVLVHIVALRPGAERSLVGSCLIEEGRLEAAADAVLDAVSRVVEPILGREEEIEYQVEEDQTR